MSAIVSKLSLIKHEPSGNFTIQNRRVFSPVLHIFLKNTIILNLIFQNLLRMCDGNIKTADHLLLITFTSWSLY